MSIPVPRRRLRGSGIAAWHTVAEWRGREARWGTGGFRPCGAPQVRTEAAESDKDPRNWEVGTAAARILSNQTPGFAWQCWPERVENQSMGALPRAM